MEPTTIIQASIFEEEKIRQTLQGQKADFCIVAPPWGEASYKYWQTINKRQTGAAYPPSTYEEFLHALSRRIKEHVDGFIVIYMSCNEEELVIDTLEEYGLSWHHTYFSNYGTPQRPFYVMVFDTDGAQPPYNSYGLLELNGLHRARKIFSTLEPKNLVLDFCAGLGDFAVVAKEYGVPYIGFELNAARVEKAKERLKCK